MILVMKRSLLLAALIGYGLAAAGADGPQKELDRLPKCPATRARAAHDWSQVGGRFLVSLPPSCREEAGRRFVHGGSRWQCGTVTVEMVWGMWGLGSFSESATKCAADVAGLRVMVVREPPAKGPHLVVWYPIGEVHEPLLSAWSDRTEDLPIVEGIAFSGKRVKTPE
jgi:hypothetical protein